LNHAKLFMQELHVIKTINKRTSRYVQFRIGKIATARVAQVWFKWHRAE